MQRQITRFTPFQLPAAMLTSLLLAVVLAFGLAGLAQAQDKAQAQKPAGLTTLKTDTPEEGFALAVKLAQKGVATVQKDPAVRKELRPGYDHNPASLIAVSHVIATHFQTISAANNYWAQ
ncbi:hexameric tyrosine-coordinated heme protein [Castellaniella sp.]|uniref:hexameric tyrosine-coordinated heme protein n=1 Tax=Castellaniella sp. TaxID=1955812 RepID=UPI00356B2BC8